MSGQYNDLVERMFVIDCRYPYEYDGGHIKVRLLLACDLTLMQVACSRICVGQIDDYLCPPFRELLTSIKRIKLKTTFCWILFSRKAQRSVSCWFSTVNFHLNVAHGCAATFEKEIEIWMRRNTPTSITLNSISWREATKTFSRFTRYVQFHNATLSLYSYISKFFFISSC